MTPPSRRRPLTALLLTLPLATAATDPDCGSPTYSGFALKSGTACRSYVYCQSGEAASETACPEGLLFDGGAGRGGICTWPEGVACPVDEEEGGSAAAATTEATATTDIESTATAAATAATDRGDGAGGPGNFYCGTSREDAAARCVPCPSGSLMDCPDVTHGCFPGVDGCSAGGGDDQSDAGGEDGDGGSGTTLQDLLDSLSDGSSAGDSGASSTAATTAAETFVAAPTPAATKPAATSSIDLDASSFESADPDATPQPSLSPTLPPWTNAPFVPYRGSPRPKTVIGYYASWQWYDRNKFADPKNVDFGKYDRINYAFFQPDEQGRIYGTDEWADPQLLWGRYDYSATTQITSGPDRNYFCSWDGPDPSSHNCNFHKGDGIVSRAKAAGAQVMPSIGGWTLSDNFPGIAASEERRREFASNCVKLIEEYDFDGIDIDWEYPAYKDHSGTPEDTVNYTLFLQAIRDALDALGNARGRYFPLSAALPCGPDKIADIQVDKIKDILDELNLMSYDLHGAWDVLTGTNAPMFDQGWTDKSKGWSIHGCAENYLEQGVDVAKINIGLPFYGRSFRKATGFKQTHEGPDDINFHLDEGSPQYFNIVKELARMTTYRHENTQTQYAVFNEGGGLVSYDDARAICDKVHYANERGMHGFLVWEISGDMLDNGETPLIDATNAKIDNPDLDCGSLRDPIWALSDTEYRYAPPEPEYVDWTSVNPLNLASPMGYSNGDAAPAPAPTPTAPTAPTGLTPDTFNTLIGINPATRPPAPAPTPAAPSDGKCPPGHTGYAASADCTQYMYCSGGAVVGAMMPCVPGTLFDVSISACVLGSVLGCSR